MTDFHLVAAALRRDASDVAAYAGALTATLADALPPGCVAVEHDRSLSDRLRGREGTVRRVVVRLGERALALGPGQVAEIHHEVRGIVVSRERVGLDAWLEALARELVACAAGNARAAEALRRLLGQPPL